MATKKPTRRSGQLTTRFTEKELEKIREYCAENGMTGSEYIRYLVRIHLGMADDMIAIYNARLPRKK